MLVGHKKIHLQCVLIVACSIVASQAQEPGKPKDPAPFVRPKPLCVFSTSDVRKTFQKISALVTEEKFKADDINWSDGELSAWRPDSNTSPNQDKILIWLERDFDQPQTKVRLYLLYARYEKFFGSSSDLTRVKADADFESSRIGQLKQKLIDLAASGGA